MKKNSDNQEFYSKNEKIHQRIKEFIYDEVIEQIVIEGVNDEVGAFAWLYEEVKKHCSQFVCNEETPLKSLVAEANVENEEECGEEDSEQKWENELRNEFVRIRDDAIKIGVYCLDLSENINKYCLEFLGNNTDNKKEHSVSIKADEFVEFIKFCNKKFPGIITCGFPVVLGTLFPVLERLSAKEFMRRFKESMRKEIDPKIWFILYNTLKIKLIQSDDGYFSCFFALSNKKETRLVAQKLQKLGYWSWATELYKDSLNLSNDTKSIFPVNFRNSKAWRIFATDDPKKDAQLIDIKNIPVEHRANIVQLFSSETYLESMKLRSMIESAINPSSALQDVFGDNVQNQEGVTIAAVFGAVDDSESLWDFAFYHVVSCRIILEKQHEFSEEFLLLELERLTTIYYKLLQNNPLSFLRMTEVSEKLELFERKKLYLSDIVDFCNKIKSLLPQRNIKPDLDLLRRNILLRLVGIANYTKSVFYKTQPAWHLNMLRALNHKVYMFNYSVYSELFDSDLPFGKSFHNVFCGLQLLKLTLRKIEWGKLPILKYFREIDLGGEELGGETDFHLGVLACVKFQAACAVWGVIKKRWRYGKTEKIEKIENTEIVELYKSAIVYLGRIGHKKVEHYRLLSRCCSDLAGIMRFCDNKAEFLRYIKSAITERFNIASLYPSSWRESDRELIRGNMFSFFSLLFLKKGGREENMTAIDVVREVDKPGFCLLLFSIENDMMRYIFSKLTYNYSKNTPQCYGLTKERPLVYLLKRLVEKDYKKSLVGENNGKNGGVDFFDLMLNMCGADGVRGAVLVFLSSSSIDVKFKFFARGFSRPITPLEFAFEYDEAEIFAAIATNLKLDLTTKVERYNSITASYESHSWVVWAVLANKIDIVKYLFKPSINTKIARFNHFITYSKSKSKKSEETGDNFEQRIVANVSSEIIAAAVQNLAEGDSKYVAILLTKDTVNGIFASCMRFLCDEGVYGSSKAKNIICFFKEIVSRNHLFFIDLNRGFGDGAMTLLHIGAKCGDFGLLKLLFAQDDIKIVANRYGDTPDMFAANEKMRFYIKTAFLYIRTKQICMGADKIDSFYVQLAMNSDVNIKKYKFGSALKTCLQLAGFYKNGELEKLLLGSDNWKKLFQLADQLNTVRSKKSVSLDGICEWIKVKQLKSFINTKYNGDTLLHKAIEWKWGELIIFLSIGKIKKGGSWKLWDGKLSANPLIRNSQGENAIELASRLKLNPSILKVLEIAKKNNSVVSKQVGFNYGGSDQGKKDQQNRDKSDDEEDSDLYQNNQII